MLGSEKRRRQARVDIGIWNASRKCSIVPAPPEANQRHAATSRTFQLRQIAEPLRAVTGPSYWGRFPRTALLYLLRPIQRLPLRHAGTVFIAGMLVNMIFPSEN
ncbi:hypothetical protein KCP73_22600 [Salmonella enterica subsp. enterica]|nr:hypothetical protein KCP73_22600 [Salmonella enterica subsp. enterica]